MADILGMMDYIGQKSQEGRQMGQQRRLAELAQQSMQAPREQRQGLLAQMAGVSPQAAYDAQGHFKGMDDTARARLGEYASAFDALPDEQKAAAYPQLAKQAQELGIPAPGEWNPAFAPNITKLAQALRGGAAGGPAGLQEFQYMAKGLTPEDELKARRVALGLEGRASNAGFQTIEVEQSDGSKARFTFDPRRNVYTPFVEGGAPQAPAQGQPAAGEVPFSIDPNLPPAVQAAIRSDRQKFDSVPDGGTIRVPGVVPTGPRPGVGMSVADKKAAEVAAQQATELQYLRPRGEIEAQNEGRKVLAKGAAEAQVAQQFGTDESRKQAADASKKLPQLAAVGRGVERIANALKALNMPGVNTGPLDQYITRQLPAGQELETAVGEIQDSMLALVRVPGVGSQSDLEARVSAMKYPSLNRDPAVNARTMKNLLALYQDLRSAYDNVINRPAASNGGGNGDRRRALLDKY